jgi:F0F1-type ATP synthase assembly protein I
MTKTEIQGSMVTQGVALAVCFVCSIFVGMAIGMYDEWNSARISAAAFLVFLIVPEVVFVNNIRELIRKLGAAKGE